MIHLYTCVLWCSHPLKRQPQTDPPGFSNKTERSRLRSPIRAHRYPHYLVHDTHLLAGCRTNTGVTQVSINAACEICLKLESKVPVPTGAIPEGQDMRVEGMWPYWLDGHAANTVRNSFDMSSMYLLTGELLHDCCNK